MRWSAAMYRTLPSSPQLRFPVGTPVSMRPSRAAHVGTQMTLQLEWRVDRHTSYTATYTHFATGRFLSEAPPGRNVESLMTWVSYRF